MVDVAASLALARLLDKICVLIYTIFMRAERLPKTRRIICVRVCVCVCWVVVKIHPMRLSPEIYCALEHLSSFCYGYCVCVCMFCLGPHYVECDCVHKSHPLPIIRISNSSDFVHSPHVFFTTAEHFVGTFFELAYGLSIYSIEPCLLLSILESRVSKNGGSKVGASKSEDKTKNAANEGHIFGV